jgi:ATP-dependent Clp protease ATP-binding subunit ClpC
MPFALPASVHLTPAAQAVFVAAESEARALGHPHLRTDHLLLGVLADPDTTATRLLQSVGVTRTVVYQVLHDLDTPADMPIFPSSTNGITIDLSPHTLGVLSLAASEASQMPQPVITPELLVMGIVREGEGVGAKVLGSLGVDTENVCSPPTAP